MKNMMLVAALVAAVGFGCKKKKAEEGTGGGPTTGSDMAGSGSAAAGSGSGAAMAGSGSAAAPKPMTAEDESKRFEACWGFYNTAKWDDFKGCESPGMPMPPMTGGDAIVAGAKAFKDAIPDDHGDAVLELISGHTIIAVTATWGTNTGELKVPGMTMPASKNKVGAMFAQVIEWDDSGKAKKEWDFFDMATMMGQMKPDPKHPVRAALDKSPMPKEVVIAKDDANEKANTELVKKTAEAFSKHDAKAFGDLLADDVKWSEQAQPKDSDKKGTVANAQAFWKAFSDVKITPTQTWAAGDYVAVVATMDGTNDGDLKDMGLKKTGKKISVPHLGVFKVQGGKVKAAWIFDQGMAFAMQLGLMPPPGAGGGEKKDEKAGEKKDEKKAPEKKDEKKAPAPEKKG